MTRRFFHESDLRAGASVVLTKRDHADELKHMRKALRLAPGDSVVLTDGRGHEAEATIEALAADSASLRLKTVRGLERTRPRIALAQGLLKGQRMDWIVEKATELEAAEIVALVTRFSVASEDEAAGRTGRWQRLAKSALKQSGVPFLPDIVGPVSFADFLSTLASPASAREARVFLHPGAENPPLLELLLSLNRSAGTRLESLLLCLGPEGGFDPEEVLNLKDAGFRAASLGSAILRGETAALAALAVAKQWSIADNNY